MLSLLAGCASASDPSLRDWTPPKPAAIDKDVAAVLPSGPYLVSGGLYSNGTRTTKVEGYVDFGSDPDGRDCQTDHVLTTTAAGAVVTASRSVRAAGGPSWFRDETPGSTRTEWRDISSYEMRKVLLIFLPAMLVSEYAPGVVENGGDGDLCSIPAIARLMRVAQTSTRTTALEWRPDAVRAAADASHGRWIQKYLDAEGVTGRSRELGLREQLDMPRPHFASLTEKFDSIVITRRGDKVTLTQAHRDEPVRVKLVFTPTSRRTIVAPESATMFDQIAGNLNKTASR